MRPGGSVLIRAAGGLLALAIVGVLVKGWTASALQPDFGFFSEATPSGWLVIDVPKGGLADAAGVRVGDHVLSVDGQETSDPSVGSDVRVGQRVTLHIQHASVAGQPPSDTDIAYTIANAFASPENVVGILTFSVSSLLTLLIVLFVAVVRPRDFAARLLLVGGGGVALMEALAVWTNAQYDLAAARVYYLSATLAITALLHLFLAFPVPSPLLARLRGLRLLGRPGAGVALLYGIPLLLTTTLTLPEGGAGNGAVITYGDWSYLPDVVIMVCALAAMLRGYRRAPTPLARAQMTWILWAFAVFSLVVVVSLPGPLFATGSVPQVSFVACGLSWLLFPLAVAFAILRYRLFDVDAVVRATFLYPLLAGVLVAAYVVVAFLLERVTLALFGPTAAGDPSVNVLAALVLAAAAHPVRARLQAGLDRVTYRERRARQALAAEASETVRRVPSVAAIVELLTTRTAARLQLSGAWVVLAPGMADEPVDGGLPAPAETLLGHAAQTSGPVLLEDAATPDMETWFGSGARLLIPLRTDHLLGAWALGGRRSGELFDREDLDVLTAIGNQMAVFLDYARLERDEVRQAVARRELERARELQRRLLPAQPEGWPGRLEIAARLHSARETSGDFYDVFALGAERATSAARPPLQIAVGDVAGKGIGAALVMALARTALRATASPAHTLQGRRDIDLLPGPAATLAHVGRLLHRDIGRRDFVACALALLEAMGEDSPGVRMRLANGGQVAPVLCRDGCIQELTPPGERLPLGFLAEPAYCELERVLHPGDTVVFASDGLPEAPSQVGELYGFERLYDSIARWSPRLDSASDVLAALWADMEAWARPNPEHDDMTLLVLRICTPRR